MWFEDQDIVACLPLYYRAYAGFCRMMADRDSGLVRGGSFVFRMMRRVVTRFGLADFAAVSISGQTVFLDLLDPRIFMVFGELDASSREAQILRHALRAGDTFLDIGANHGSISLLARSVVGESGLVVAFEPNPRLATLIERSFEANGFRNCLVKNVALSDRRGHLTLYIPKSNSGAAGVYRSFSAVSEHLPIDVEVVDIDHGVEWSSLPGRIFVKLDVEGSELAVITGAEQMIRTRRPTFLLELNPSSATAAGNSVEDVVDRLRDFGYDRVAEIDQYPQSTPISDLDCSRQRNIIVLP